MRLRHVFALAVLSALSIGTAGANAALYDQVKSGSMPDVPSIDDPQFQADALWAHNIERRYVGVPDLRWSPQLAREAKAWVDHIAPYGVLQHAPQTGDNKQGENIWLNTVGRRTVGSMIAGWSIEKNIYIVGGRHPNVSTTGNWHDVGHYTQMVWASTTEVGCAVGRGPKKDILVCRYAPMGNWRGEMAFDPGRVPVAVASTPSEPTLARPFAAGGEAVPTPGAKPSVSASAR